MICIRPAELFEAGILTDLASKSEAYWGYDSDFMKKFGEVYKVTEDFLCKNTTFIISENDAIIGFYSVSTGEEECSLEYFYIDPRNIGKGYGRILCEHMMEYCKKLGIKEIFAVTSPQAKEFYEKMGAVQVAEVESLLKKGRVIPKLKFSFVSE